MGSLPRIVVHEAADSPAHDPTRPGVDHQCDLNRASDHGDGGDVGDPRPAGTVGLHASREAGEHRLWLLSVVATKWLWRRGCLCSRINRRHQIRHYGSLARFCQVGRENLSSAFRSVLPHLINTVCRVRLRNVILAARSARKSSLWTLFGPCARIGTRRKTCSP